MWDYTTRNSVYHKAETPFPFFPASIVVLVLLRNNGQSSACHCPASYIALIDSEIDASASTKAEVLTEHQPLPVIARFCSFSSRGFHRWFGESVSFWTLATLCQSCYSLLLLLTARRFTLKCTLKLSCVNGIHFVEGTQQ